MTDKAIQARRYLDDIRSLNLRISARHEQLMRLRARLEPGAARLTGMPGGGKALDWTELSAAAMELESEIAGEIRQLTDMRRERLETIESVEDGTLRTLLELRYISCLTFREIGEKMHYDPNWAFRLHYRALEQIVIPADETQQNTTNTNVL